MVDADNRTKVTYNIEVAVPVSPYMFDCDSIQELEDTLQAKPTTMECCPVPGQRHWPLTECGNGRFKSLGDGGRVCETNLAFGPVEAILVAEAANNILG